MGSTAAHDSAGISFLRARRKSLEATMKNDWSEHPGTNGMLVEMFELKCSSLGLSKAVLEVKATNEPAINLYVKRGFKVMGVIKNYYPDASDALIMEKVLKGLSKQWPSG